MNIHREYLIKMEEIVRSNEELSKHCQVRAAPLYV
jgi:hypothetical protein